MNYEYKREDGSLFVIKQSMDDEPLQVCPTTGQKVVRVISGGLATSIPGHMMAPGSKFSHNPDSLPTTMRHYQNRVFKPEYRPGDE